MIASARRIRAVFLLQMAILCLVVALCILGAQVVHGGQDVPQVAFAAASIALASIVAATWMTWRATRRAMAPMNWLLAQVRHWDPRRPDTGVLASERIPEHVQGEIRTLAEVLHGLGARTEALIARERDFTRDASHELRTPLTVIGLATELIGQDAGLSERSRCSLARVQGAASSMESLVDALLMLARDGGVMPASEDFAVRGVVEHEIEAIRPWLRDKPVDIELRVEADPVLHAPPRALGVMLGSLLSNAARFTEAGRIRVFLRGDRVDVEDTGIGMDAAVLARATDPFYRADPGQTGGPGLGLSIAHRLGRRCGWPLELNSVPGLGTRASILFAPRAA